MVRDYYEQTGDLSIIDEYRYTMESILHWWRVRKNADGLVGKTEYWHFIDWAGLKHPEGMSSTIENCMYVSALRDTAYMVEALGIEGLADYYSKEADSVADAIKTQCFDKKRGLFTEAPGLYAYSQHAQVWAVLGQVVRGQEAGDIMRKTLDGSDLIKCTFGYCYYLFRALEQAGLYERTENLWRLWDAFLEQGLTTIPETPGLNPRSDCQAWGAMLLYEYPRKILGVYPAKPGYEVIGIKPQGLYMKEAAGTVVTPKGLVEISWKYDKGQFSLQGSLPEGTKGMIELPDGKVHQTGGGEFCFFCT
jgi:hypothetical protein